MNYGKWLRENAPSLVHQIEETETANAAANAAMGFRCSTCGTSDSTVYALVCRKCLSGLIAAHERAMGDAAGAIHAKHTAQIWSNIWFVMALILAGILGFVVYAR